MAFPEALPSARTPDPFEAPVLRWGILGTGWIAERFSAALRADTGQLVQAVGSRTADSASRAATAFGAVTAHAGYEQLVADPEVDIVYVATPHTHHHPHGMLALSAGKPVLIEKPLALNAVQARELEAAATAAGLFCMEAFWTFFLPKFDIVRQLLRDGVLGDIRTVAADHGQFFADHHRIRRPDLAGGPMLDLMTYPAGLAHWVLGDPSEVVARTTWTPSGVAGQVSLMLSTAAHQQALLHSSIEGPTPCTAFIGGSTARLSFDEDFYQPGGFTLTAADGTVLRHDEPRSAHAGLFWQAAEVARRVAAGETCSPLHPLSSSVATLEIMDAARAQIGERYPGE